METYNPARDSEKFNGVVSYVPGSAEKLRSHRVGSRREIHGKTRESIFVATRAQAYVGVNVEETTRPAACRDDI